jgi:hypothetical protein
MKKRSLKIRPDDTPESIFKRLKNAARKRSERMVLSGDLRSATICERCGDEPAPVMRSNGRRQSRMEMHHLDYNDPSQIEWLCKDCHMGVHGSRHRVKVDRIPRVAKTPIVPREPKQSKRPGNILWAHNAYPDRPRARASIEISD